MKIRSLLLAAICMSGLIASTAFAEPIDFFTGTVGTAHTQLGRLSRNGVAQTWLHTEATPITFNPTTTYYYTTYTYTTSTFTGAPYVDISVYDENSAGNFFVSAYSGAYDSTNLQKNFLGDEGASGNIQFAPPPFPGDARFFDVILPANSDLILVVNSTGTGTLGTASPYDIAINAYADTNFDEPVPVAVTPEPSTFLELGTGLLAMAGVARRRLRIA